MTVTRFVAGTKRKCGRKPFPRDEDGEIIRLVNDGITKQPFKVPSRVSRRKIIVPSRLVAKDSSQWAEHVRSEAGESMEE